MILEKKNIVIDRKNKNFIFLIHFTLILMHFTYHAKRNIFIFYVLLCYYLMFILIVDLF